MTTLNLHQQQKTERLTDAFRIFNQLSENLAQSYQGLEEQIARLNLELQAARSERLNTLIEKEKLASRLQQILAALPAGVVVLNRNGLIVDCNVHAIDFLGEPLIGLHWQNVVARSLLPVFDSPHERQLQDGRKITLTHSVLANEAEQLVLLSDVSELRALQDTLAQQQHLSAMGEMVASLAHQVRTPLATAVLYASQLANPSVELAAEKRGQFASRILERLHYLERQVNDMLIFAKQGRLAMQSFPISALLLSISETAESLPCVVAIENQLDDLTLLGNQDALRGAIINLLNNAVEAGATQIQLCTSGLSDGGWQVAVTDDGPGMSAEILDRIFEPFYTRKSNGTGLGLAVVESVIKAHGGDVICRSRPGQGASFILTLPGASLTALGLSAGAQHTGACL